MRSGMGGGGIEEEKSEIVKRMRSGMGGGWIEEEKSEIPADIYELEILPYLPSTNLQTLKTVSKHLLQLITNPYFVRLHLSRAYESRIRVLITFPREILEYNNYSYSYSYDDDQQRRIPYPRQFSYDNSLTRFTCLLRQFSASQIEIVGSADGLICLFNRKFDIIGGHGVVFNPSTGECLEVWPQSPELYITLCSWFGKSCVDDGESYVLVVVYCSCSAGMGYEFGVYKLTCSKLKRIRSTNVPLRILHNFCGIDRGTLVQGAVHWPIRQRIPKPMRQFGFYNRYLILAYHPYENKYWKMFPPAQCEFRLGVTPDGCLFATLKNDVVGVFEVWIMKDSWTKWADIEGDFCNSKVLSPLGFFPDGDLIFDVDKSKLMRYNFNRKVATLLMEYHPHGCCGHQAIMCADTLVSPSSILDC